MAAHRLHAGSARVGLLRSEASISVGEPFDFDGPRKAVALPVGVVHRELHVVIALRRKGVFRRRGCQTHLRCLVAEVPIPGHDLYVVLRTGTVERAGVLVAVLAEVGRRWLAQYWLR